MSVRQDEELKLWFKTPFKTSVRQVLKVRVALEGQASHAFRAKVQSTFCLSDAELELVLPKSEKVTCEKTNTDIQLYFTDPTQPLFFEPNKGRGSLYPTLFAVWKYPNLVPRVYAYSTPVQHIVTSQLQPMYRVAQWIPMLPDAFFTQKVSNTSAPSDLLFVPKDDASRRILETRTLAGAHSFASGENCLKSWTGLSQREFSSESKANLYGELDISLGGLGSRAFDFNYSPNQIRALFVVGEPHAVAIGVVQCKLNDLLAFGQSATKLYVENPEEDFSQFPWPMQPWPSTWPPESVLSDNVENAVGAFKTAASANLTGTSIIEPHKLLESRSVGKGECISLVNLLGDQLTLASPTRIPKCFTLVPTAKAGGMNAVIVKTDAYKVEWAKLFMALRLSWLGCLLPQTSSLSVEEGESAKDKEDFDEPTISEQEEGTATRETGKDSRKENEVTEEEKVYKDADSNVDPDSSEEIPETENIEDPAESSISPETMSQYIVNAFIVAAKTRIKDKMLPLDASGIMSNHLKFCAVRSLISPSDSDDRHETLPRFLRLDLKKSTFKTLSKLINHLQEKDVLTSKNVRSALNITSINRRSELLTTFTITQQMQEDIKDYERFLKNESAELAAAAALNVSADQQSMSYIGQQLLLPVTAIRLTTSQVEFLLDRPEGKYLCENDDDKENEVQEAKHTDAQLYAKLEESIARYLFSTRNLILDHTLMRRSVRGYIQEAHLLQKPLFGSAPLVTVDNTLSKVLHGCKGQTFPVSELDAKLKRSLTMVTAILPGMIHNLGANFGQKEMNASRKILLDAWQSEERHRILATIKASTWSSRMSESCSIQSVRDKRGDFLTIITELEIFGPTLIEAFRSNSNVKKHLACNVEVKPLPPLLKNRLARNIEDKDVVILHGKLEEKAIDLLVNRIGVPKDHVKQI